MMKLMSVSAVMLAALLAVPGLRAETTVIARAGSWEAFGGTTNRNNPVCGVSTKLDDGRYVGVKLFGSADTFTVQIGWRQWSINNGDSQQIELTMDGNRGWQVNAAGMHFGDGDAGLEFTIDAKQLGNFVREFRESNQMRLQFPGSGAQDWFISLAGTSAVTNAFEGCIRNM